MTNRDNAHKILRGARKYCKEHSDQEAWNIIALKTNLLLAEEIEEAFPETKNNPIIGCVKERNQ